MSTSDYGGMGERKKLVTQRSARGDLRQAPRRGREIRKLPDKYRARIREEDKLMALLGRAHAEHDASAAR